MYSSLSLFALFFSLCAISVRASPLTLTNRANLGSTSQKDLATGKACKAMTVIFARGTTEPGNVGMVAGPPMFKALGKIVGADKLAIQGVTYPADVPGFLAGGDADGSKEMAKLIKQAATNCPDTAIVMCGYSQGGQLVHNAAKQLDSETASKVSSAVIFGDPNNGDAVENIPASKTKVICHATDNICAHGSLILPAHLTYGQDAQDAAEFVAAAAGMA